MIYTPITNEIIIPTQFVENRISYTSSRVVYG